MNKQPPKTASCKFVSPGLVATDNRQPDVNLISEGFRACQLNRQQTGVKSEFAKSCKSATDNWQSDANSTRGSYGE